MMTLNVRNDHKIVRDGDKNFLASPTARSNVPRLRTDGGRRGSKAVGLGGRSGRLIEIRREFRDE